MADRQVQRGEGGSGACSIPHLMVLARLALEPAELARLERELARILSRFEMLRGVTPRGALDPSREEPPGMLLRPDEPRPGLDPEAALRDAPRREDDCFRVPSPIPARQEPP